MENFHASSASQRSDTLVGQHAFVSFDGAFSGATGGQRALHRHHVDMCARRAFAAGACATELSGNKFVRWKPAICWDFGVVLGLFGYLAVKTKIRRDLGIYFPPDSYFMVGFIIVVGLIGAMPFANLAHIGGLLTGAALGYFWNR